VRELGIIFVLLVLASCGGEPLGSGTTGDSSNAARASELRTVTLNASSGEEVKVWVEVADNQLGRVIGLRWRERLPENRGMLFVYPDEEKRSFTMEDTVIPLSIAFMDSEGRIVDIQDMKPLEAGPYVSAKPAQYALEVNRGFFEEHDIKVGDRAELPV
jgi:uncharacterized membrane protein (UPF0127 family)